MFQNMIEKAINKSQHCQRNWDIEKSIPETDLHTLEVAITACPSKQNYVFYKPYMVTNRDIIEKLYHTSDGFMLSDGTSKKNPQLLANLVVVFVESDDFLNQIPRNKEASNSLKSNQIHPSMEVQRRLSIGIASGYLNLTANLLGYSTGCCTCFNRAEVSKILGTDRVAHLMMGVGIPDGDRPRREHHEEPDFTFPTFSKNLEAIKIH